MSTDHTLAMIQYAQAQKAAAEAFLAAVADIADDESGADEDKSAPRKVAAKKAAPLPAKKAPAKAAAKAAPAKKALAKPAPEPEPEEEEEEVTRVDELLAMSLAQLRALAIKRGFDENETKAEKSKSVLAEAIAADELAEGEAAEDDEDEDDGEEKQFTREDLQGKGLRELKALAKEAGHTVEDLRGLDADSVIDLLLGEGEDAEEEDGEDGEENYVTEKQLKTYSLAELKKLAKDYGLTVPRGADEAALIELILADDGEADDEEE